MTQKILHISTSPLGQNSVTRELGAGLLSALTQKYPGVVVTTRDLASAPLPHLDGALLGSFATPAEQRTPEQSRLVRPSDTAIDEIMGADLIVIEAPMWNFGIPSSLKAWIDHICRVGKTFKYTDTGPVGLVSARKKVIVISARGGVYSQGPMAEMDHQESYLRSVLGFIGLKDVDFVRAEGVSMGPDAALAAKESARAKIDLLTSSAA